jgi:hypothetical protein
MKTDHNLFWREIQKVQSLMHVAAPILVFKPQHGTRMPEKWEVGETYALKLYAFHIIPLGKHSIDVKRIDPENREILTHEHGSLTKTWNHLIRMKEIDGTTAWYTDEIEIEAGIITPLIWAFAHIFYRHRQRKWKKVLSQS